MSDFTVATNAEEVAHDLRQLADRIAADTHYAIAAGTEAAAEAARGTALFKDNTQRLRSSIVTSEGRGGMAGYVDAKAPYASFVNDGTRAHEIHAKGGGLLKFQVNGHWVSTRTVHHPGTKPRPFMTLALLAGGEVLDRTLHESLDRTAAAFSSR